MKRKFRSRDEAALARYFSAAGHKRISRRDFLNGIAVAAGGALFSKPPRHPFMGGSEF